MEIDAMNDDPPVIAGIWAHQGPPKAAQRNKVLPDAFKLSHVAAESGMAVADLD